MRGGGTIPSKDNSEGCAVIRLVGIATKEGHIGVVSVKDLVHCIGGITRWVPVGEVVAIRGRRVILHSDGSVHGLIHPRVIGRYGICGIDQHIILGFIQHRNIHLSAKINAGRLTSHFPPNSRELWQNV